MTKARAGFCCVWLLAVSMAGCAANGAMVLTRDPFNGPSRSFARYLDPGHYTAVGMAQGGGKTTLQVMVVDRGQAHFVGHPGDKGDFKLGGQTLTLAAASEATPVTNASQYEVFTQWMIVYDLSPEQVLQFSAAPLSAVRVALGDRTYQLELSEADAQLIRENASMLASASAK